jgi:hypothetical protein
MDLYAGFRRNVTEALLVDLNFLYYLHPGADGSLDYDYYELTPA